jgi:nitroreductase
VSGGASRQGTAAIPCCPQIAWAEYHRTVAEVIKPPDGHVLACGMSIGYADPEEPQRPMPRAPLPEVVIFLDS